MIPCGNSPSPTQSFTYALHLFTIRRVFSLTTVHELTDQSEANVYGSLKDRNTQSYFKASRIVTTQQPRSPSGGSTTTVIHTNVMFLIKSVAAHVAPAREPLARSSRWQSSSTARSACVFGLKRFDTRFSQFGYLTTRAARDLSVRHCRQWTPRALVRRASDNTLTSHPRYYR